MTWQTESELEDLREMKKAIIAVCVARIERYPDGPFVVPISEVLEAAGVSLEELAGLN